MTENLSNHWRAYIPGDFYYRDVYLDKPGNALAARKSLRESMRVKRLPAGTHIEIAKPLNISYPKSGDPNYHWMWAAE